FAATVDGELVVDLWGGYADAARTRPWTRDTIVNVFSTTKAMTALCAHMLVDRGLLDLDAPVARYWPEFAQNGKRALPVHYLLSHRAGLAAIRQPLPTEAFYDWDRMVGALAAETPWWEPGTTSGYHAMTFGYLVGEPIRRVSGKTPGRFLRREGVPDGVRLLRGETLGRAIEAQFDGTDIVLGLPMRWGLGFMLASDRLPMGPNRRAFGHGGWGGSLAVADADARVSWAYVMNKMSPGTTGDSRAARVVAALYGAL